MLDASIFSFSNDAVYPTTDITVHVGYIFWSANAFHLNKSRISQYGKESMQNCCNMTNYKPVQKYVSDPYQSLSSIYNTYCSLCHREVTASIGIVLIDMTTITRVLLKCNPLPDDKILDWSKLKQIADDIFKYI